jgi:hypothetical protein
MFSSTYASLAQQERLINLLHLANIEPGYEDSERGLSLVTAVHECLYSANFWEQENIRCEITSSPGFLAATNLSSIVLCCSTLQNRISGHGRRGEITEENEGA